MTDCYRPVRWQDFARDIGRSGDEAVWLSAVPVLGCTGLPLFPGRGEVIIERMLADPDQVPAMVSASGARLAPDGSLLVPTVLERVEIREPAILIGGGSSWLSWVLHTLPRLEQARRQAPEDARLVLSAPPSAVMRQALALLRLEEGRLLVPAVGSVTIFHELCLLPLINCRLAGGGGALLDPAWPGRAVMPLVDAVGWSGPAVRRLACLPEGWRNPAIDAVLANDGYRLLEPENLSLADLIRALRETACLLAPTIQLLGLAPFLPPGSRVIEIGPGPTSPILGHILRHVGLGHQAQAGILPGQAHHGAQPAQG